jgi:hypothetical protein
MIGRPRKRASSRCSTEAKNESTSACRIVASCGTNVCSQQSLLGGKPPAQTAMARRRSPSALRTLL